MKKLLLVIFLLLLFTFSVHAQNTNVTATITDAGGQTWNNGTYTFNFIPKPQFNGSYRLSGAPYTSVPVTGSLSSVGAFTSVPVPDNNLITPTGTQWTVTVCAQTQFICFTSGFLTITGASQTITSSVIPPAISTTCGPGAVAYADSEVNCSIGGQYYNLTSLGSRQCTAVTGNACTTWTSAGGGITVASLPGGNQIYAATSCPASTPQCFQVFDDVQMSENATWTNASTTVTTIANDPAFVAGDVGKIEFGAGNCPGTSVNCTYMVPQGTILTVVSAHNVTVSVAATASSPATVNINNFFWGHDDGAQLVAAFAALFPYTFGSTQLLTQPQKTLRLPCGMMFTSLPPFIVGAAGGTNPANNGGGLVGCGGPSVTIVIPLPKMNCNVSTFIGCMFSNGMIPIANPGNILVGWHVRDITFWGGGTDVKDAAATYSNPANAIVINTFDELDNVWVIGWVWNSSNTVGIFNNGGVMTNSGSFGGGVTNCKFSGSVAVGAVIYGGGCGNSPGHIGFVVSNTSVGAMVSSYGVSITNSASLTAGIWNDYGSAIISSTFISGGFGYLHGTLTGQNGGGNSALTVSGGVVHLAAARIDATSGAPINISAGTIYDDCGNIFADTPTALVISGGSIIGTCSLSQQATNTAVASRNTSLGTTALLPAVRWPGPNITIELYAYDSAAGASCAGNTTVTWTISYTDPTGTAQTSTAVETIATNGGATGADSLRVTFPISVNPNTAINYSTVYAIGGSCSPGPSYAANLKVI